MTAETVFQLQLEVIEGPGLEARLLNRSSASRWILHNNDQQPSRITLTDGAGKEHPVFDERTRQKFDTSVSKAMYSEVAPGESLTLEQERFEKESAGYELNWGPFRLSEIPAGLWKARVTFESKIDWVTAGGKQVPAGKPVWKGKLVSNEVEVTLR